MDRKAALQRVYPTASLGTKQEPGGAPTDQPNPEEPLIFVLLLSLGLWALIWVGISLLGVYG